MTQSLEKQIGKKEQQLSALNAKYNILGVQLAELKDLKAFGLTAREQVINELIRNHYEGEKIVVQFERVLNELNALYAKRNDEEARKLREYTEQSADPDQLLQALYKEFNERKSANRANAVKWLSSERGRLDSLNEEWAANVDIHANISRLIKENSLADRENVSLNKQRREVELHSAGKACWNKEKQSKGKRTRRSICQDYLDKHTIKGKPNYTFVQLERYISNTQHKY